MNKAIIRKYNVAGPRYTSYPLVTAWNTDSFTIENCKRGVKNTFDESNATDGIGVYIHLPYCESLCTYCDCNTRVTVNHGVEGPYIESILKEWKLYLALFDEVPNIAELHLGRGTPTFFSPDNLRYLIESIRETVTILPDTELGFGGHPSNTSYEHMQVLYDLGFRSMSLGIQDFDPDVQETINRVQTYETVEQVVIQVVEQARAIGYQPINFDLIYGLPLQTYDTIRDTVKKVAMLQPDHIAFHSYAHVPWVKPRQTKFVEKLPDEQTKRGMYELGKQLLEAIAYQEFGMDHFALASDDLSIAAHHGTLHRNFMGYTAKYTKLTVGLGASSIGDSWNAYGQNIKSVEAYQATVDRKEFPVFKGHILSKQGMSIRKQVLSLMCRLETTWDTEQDGTDYIPLSSQVRLQEFVKDNLIKTSDKHIHILPHGRPFVRNICMAIDTPFWDQKPNENRFSKVV